jgi:hypothetical protein
LTVLVLSACRSGSGDSSGSDDTGSDDTDGESDGSADLAAAYQMACRDGGDTPVDNNDRDRVLARKRALARLRGMWRPFSARMNQEGESNKFGDGRYVVSFEKIYAACVSFNKTRQVRVCISS